MCIQVSESSNGLAARRMVAQETIPLATSRQLHCRPRHSHAEPSESPLDLRHLQAAWPAHLHQAGAQSCDLPVHKKNLSMSNASDEILSLIDKKSSLLSLDFDDVPAFPSMSWSLPLAQNTPKGLIMQVATGAAALQVLFISDPELLPVMFDRALYPPNAHILDRPVDQFLQQIDAVRPAFLSIAGRLGCFTSLERWPYLALHDVPRHVAKLLPMMQLTSDSGHPNLLTAKTGDPLWRLVRKGVAPAFNPQNIRSESTLCTS